MTVLALIALLLPGFAWWAWLGRRKQDPLVSLAQIIGVSLAVIILLAEAIFFLDRSFSLLDILIILAGFAALAGIGLFKVGVKLPKKYRWHLITGLTLFGLVIAWRLYQSKDLLLPNWVDSQHHFLIIRVILEQGGLPETLSPYLPAPFYYHFGFHAIAALVTALSGLEIGKAMLVFGQVLNAAIGLSIYALGKALWKDWCPAAAAALLVSFATRMPAYYLSWGRYTLITGLIFLPLAMGIALRLLKKSYRVKDIFTLALLTAGLLLSHYFAAVLLAVFLIFLAVVHLASHIRRFRRALTRLVRVITGAGLGFLLAAPWLWRVVQFSLSKMGVSANLPDSIGSIFTDPGSGNYIWQLLGPTSNHWLLLAAGIGLLIALIQLKIIPFVLWTVVIILLTLPWGITVHPFRDDHFAIILFLPAALWAGWLFWRVGRWVAKRTKKDWLSPALLLLLVLVFIAWGITFSKDIVNPVTILVTPADLDALDWAAENTPADARFYINTTYWLSNVYRGVDGGGWLLPYSGRWSLVPTVFYGFSPNTGQNQQIRRWGERASDITTCGEDFWALIHEADLGWVYLRKGTGSLQPSTLDACDGVRQVYANETVTIYRVIRK